jgi:hypothetical protein
VAARRWTSIRPIPAPVSDWSAIKRNTSSSVDDRGGREATQVPENGGHVRRLAHGDFADHKGIAEDLLLVEQLLESIVPTSKVIDPDRSVDENHATVIVCAEEAGRFAARFRPASPSGGRSLWIKAFSASRIRRDFSLMPVNSWARAGISSSIARSCASEAAFRQRIHIASFDVEIRAGAATYRPPLSGTPNMPPGRSVSRIASRLKIATSR